MAASDVTVTSERIDGHHTAVVPDTNSYHYKIGTARIGLWLFLISDSFVFLGLFISRFYLLGDTRPELDQLLGLIVTSVLLASSFFMNRAETLIAHGDRKGFLISILITTILGLGFFIGVVAIEWPQAAQHIGGPGASAMASIFYTMTGLHAFHVVTGLIFLLIVFFNGLKGRYTAERHWTVEACAVYWHFVDVVWIFFYPALYLIGTPVSLGH